MAQANSRKPQVISEMAHKINFLKGLNTIYTFVVSKLYFLLLEFSFFSYEVLIL
jgi:hypothetical protein